MSNVPISKTQLDRLGDRIRKGENSDDDFRQLEEYRSTFTQAHGKVAGSISNTLSLEASKRAKTTKSIADKLRRESIRLTQIQDIAGCRIVVPDITEQETVVKALGRLFDQTTVVDRRERPSHGYRAVHVVVNLEGKSVEVQIRTSLQHIWAELSEKLSDITGSALKYGVGDEVLLASLAAISLEITNFEALEVELQRISKAFTSESEKLEFEEANERLERWRSAIFLELRRLIDECKKVDGEGDDIFN